MKNILTKIYIHPITYFIAFLSLFTGLFKPLYTLMFIIIVHELGHILGAIIYKWKIAKVVILPFGGITIFNEELNRPIKEEFIILIMGPLFQLIAFLIFKDLNIYFNNLNYGLFLFNFLPIYPLDGYKFWLLTFSKYLPYKLALKLMLVISYLFIIINFKLELTHILVFFFLFVGLIKESKKITKIYYKFLLERYLYKYRFHKIKTISNSNYFYKDCYHYIKLDTLISEDDYLKQKYHDF